VELSATGIQNGCSDDIALLMSFLQPTRQLVSFSPSAFSSLSPSCYKIVPEIPTNIAKEFPPRLCFGTIKHYRKNSFAILPHTAQKIFHTFPPYKDLVSTLNWQTQ
jgi:hypothetical protein